MFQFQTGVFPWYTCVIVLAPVVACLLLFLQESRLKNKIDMTAIRLAACTCIGALVGARMAYVLFSMDIFLYDMGIAAIFDLCVGSCLMYGGIFGALICAAAVARFERMSVLCTLDKLAVPGLAAIAICRFAEGFTSEGIGPMLDNEALCFFPIAVQNEYGDWNLAVFMLEAVVALIIMLAVMRIRPQLAGERIITALLLFSCSQIPLENLRWDSYMRIGFVRVSEVIAGLVILVITFLQRKRQGEHGWILHMGIAGICVVGIGLAEWAQDKTNIPNAMLFALMIVLCVLMALNAGVRITDRRRL